MLPLFRALSPEPVSLRFSASLASRLGVVGSKLLDHHEQVVERERPTGRSFRFGWAVSAEDYKSLSPGLDADAHRRRMICHPCVTLIVRFYKSPYNSKGFRPAFPCS
jgi:hypothetical protein